MAVTGRGAERGAGAAIALFFFACLLVAPLVARAAAGPAAAGDPGGGRPPRTRRPGALLRPADGDRGCHAAPGPGHAGLCRVRRCLCRRPRGVAVAAAAGRGGRGGVVRGGRLHRRPSGLGPPLAAAAVPFGGGHRRRWGADRGPLGGDPAAPGHRGDNPSRRRCQRAAGGHRPQRPEAIQTGPLERLLPRPNRRLAADITLPVRPLDIDPAAPGPCATTTSTLRFGPSSRPRPALPASTTGSSPRHNRPASDQYGRCTTRASCGRAVADQVVAARAIRGLPPAGAGWRRLSGWPEVLLVTGGGGPSNEVTRGSLKPSTAHRPTRPPPVRVPPVCTPTSPAAPRALRGDRSAVSPPPRRGPPGP